MNQNQIYNIVNTIALAIGLPLLAKYGFTADNLTSVIKDIFEVIGILTPIVLHFLHGNSASVKTQSNAPVNPTTLTKVGLILFFCVGLTLLGTGCALEKNPNNNGYVTAIQERWFGAHIASTSSTTGTPDVKFGWGSSTTYLYPVCTNSLYAAPFYSTFNTASSWNPFDTTIGESYGAGPVAVTNSGTSASTIVPKLTKPSAK